MNIFYLDKSPYTTAEWHGDKHCVKMILETAQMLSTAHHQSGGCVEGLYKATHINHPCSIWVRENTANYDWAWQLLVALCDEFQLRRGKSHATSRLIPLLETPPDIPIASEITTPALAMPDKFKSVCPVASYRRYYRSKFADGIVGYGWSDARGVPDWIIQPPKPPLSGGL